MSPRSCHLSPLTLPFPHLSLSFLQPSLPLSFTSLFIAYLLSLIPTRVCYFYPSSPFTTSLSLTLVYSPLPSPHIYLLSPIPTLICSPFPSSKAPPFFPYSFLPFCRFLNFQRCIVTTCISSLLTLASLLTCFIITCLLT